jgi:hypothetical protein
MPCCNKPASSEPQPEINIKPQGKAKYEAVAGVLASAQRNGLTKLGIVGSERFMVFMPNVFVQLRIAPQNPKTPSLN